MAQVAVAGGGAYNNRRYICRPVESGPEFQTLTKLIALNLPSGILYTPEPWRHAHASLLPAFTLRAAIENTRRRHKLLPHELIPRLRRAVPLSGEDTLSASVAEIRRLGDGRTLAIILNCPEIEEEREQIHLRLQRLGHLGLRRANIPCHVTLGRCSEPVSSSFITRIEQHAPATIDLGTVLPKLDELASALRLPNAA